MLTILLLLFIQHINFGQTPENMDSSRWYFPKKYGEKNWKLILGFDAKRSFYAGYPVKFNGLRLGAEFRGVHRFGIGAYGLQRNVEFTSIQVDQPDASDTSAVRFNVSYSSLFYERVFFKSPKWEIATPFFLSGGTVRGIYQDTTGIFKEFVNKPFSSISLGIQVKYYIFKWLSPKVSVGYRLVFNSEKEIKQAFNSPYYAFGISISIGELYKAIFKNDSPRKRLRSEIKKGEVEEEELY